jgi:hypothetical protein
MIIKVAILKIGDRIAPEPARPLIRMAKGEKK